MPGGNKNIRPEDNPKPFEKGESGNPNGRPKGYKQIFNEAITDDERIAVVRMLIVKAMDGDLKAADMIMNREEGTPIQRTKDESGKPPLIINTLMTEAELKKKLGV